MYCGEEDLLAHYLLNFDSNSNRHTIGLKNENFDSIYIGEGEWCDFKKTDTYKNTKSANQVSYFWDCLLQITSQNALDGTLTGNANLLQGRSAIFEMAQEPRFSRRALSEHIIMVIEKFPKPVDTQSMRHVTFMTSVYPSKGYVFLQLYAPHLRAEKNYRSMRTSLLEIACASAKKRFPKMKTIVGIATDAPKYAKKNEEDFILLDCSSWTKEREFYYSKLNAELNFFETDDRSETRKQISEFINN